MSGAVSGSQLWAGGRAASASIVEERRMPSSERREFPGQAAILCLDRNRDRFALEVPVVPALGGPPVGLQRVGVHLLARDPVPIGQDLADPELGPESPVHRLHERRRERPRPAPRVGGQRHPAHDLGAAGDHQVVVVRRHARGGEVDGLLRRAALAVDRRGRHCLGQSGRDPAVAGEVRALLAHLAHAPADDVVDALGVHARPLDQRGEGETQEVRRVPVGEGAAPLAERRPHDVDDDGLSHGAASFVFLMTGRCRLRCRAPPPRQRPRQPLPHDGPSASPPRRWRRPDRPRRRRSRGSARRPSWPTGAHG